MPSKRPLKRPSRGTWPCCASCWGGATASEKTGGSSASAAPCGPCSASTSSAASRFQACCCPESGGCERGLPPRFLPLLRYRLIQQGGISDEVPSTSACPGRALRLHPVRSVRRLGER